MIEEVYGWLEEETDENRDCFISSDKEDLIEYHRTLGQDIRNHFQLWANGWEPLIEDRDGIEVDASPDHPDQISMDIIEAVWEKSQNQF